MVDLVSSWFQAHLPFAVVGSTEEVKVGNKMVRARLYPWGTVQGRYPFTTVALKCKTHPLIQVHPPNENTPPKCESTPPK